MPHTLSGQIKVAKWDEKSFLETQAPTKAHEAELAYTASGDLEGKFEGKYLMIYADDDHASYVGTLKFKGTIGDKTGSFFVTETGRFENGVASTAWHIVPDSGSGSFKSLTGIGKYVAVGDKVNYEFEVEGL